MKIYKIRALVSELSREKQNEIYAELRAILMETSVTLSRKINTTGKNDFDGNQLPIIAATLSKYLSRPIMVDDLYNITEMATAV